MASPLRLLSLDGGGVRGLSSLIVLEHIMRTINPESPPKPYEYFDLIGGTSTGGLIAIMLGRLNMNVDECIDAYLQISGDVFQPRRSSFNFLGRASDAIKVRGRFNSEELKRKIQQITLASGQGVDAKLMDELYPQCRVFVCAARGDTGVHTALLRSYHSRQVKEVDCTIWEAGRATSAASSFFDPITIGKYGETFLDGATCCNNPVEEVLEEAIRIWPDAKHRISCLLSIGTGQPALPAFGKSLKQVAKTLIQIATETEQTALKFQSLHADYLGDRKIRPKVYFRFNVSKGLETVGLEEHKQRGRIAAATKEYLKIPDISRDLESCAGILKASVGSELVKPILNRLNTLSAMNIAQHCSEVRDPEGETFSWIGSRRAYNLTESATSSGIFHITGRPGCGKSVLAKYIYRLIESQTGPPEKFVIRRVVYYAFNARDEGRRTVLSILASLNAQLLEGEHTFPKHLEDLLENLSSSTSWTIRQLQDLLFNLVTCPRLALPKGSKMVFIIDAVDECDQGPLREGLLEWFHQLVESCHSTMHISFVVTSRPYADITFSGAAMTLDLNVEDAVDKDLESYIHQGTARLIQRRPPFRAYQHKIIAKLQHRAEKMFLLVELLLDRMLRLHNSSPISIERLLASLPSTLSEIYRDIWSEIAPSDQQRAKMIFSWLLCAFRPLSMTELDTAIATHEFHAACKTKDVAGLLNVTSRHDVFHPLSKLYQSQIEPFRSLDLKGDLERLFGPLIHIEKEKSYIEKFGNSLDAEGLNIALEQLLESKLQDITDTRDLRYANLPRSSGQSSYVVPPTPRITSGLRSPSAFSMVQEESPRVNLCHQTVKEHFLNDPSFLDLASVHLEMAYLCVRLRDGTIPGDDDTESVSTILAPDVDGLEDYSEHWVNHRDKAISLNPSLQGIVRFRCRKWGD